jgi:hypothetical protein
LHEKQAAVEKENCMERKNNHNILPPLYFHSAVAAHEFVIKHKKLASHIAVFLCSFSSRLKKQNTFDCERKGEGGGLRERRETFLFMNF